MLSERFDEALVFASSLHRQQVRKATSIPYVSHLLAVSSLVLEDDGSEDEAIAGLLHDSIEDCGDEYPGGRQALRALIRERFGNDVLRIVNECTDDDGEPKGKAPTLEAERLAWRHRKERYLAHLGDCGLPTLRVSCADKLHNLRSILADHEQMGDALWSRFRARSAEYQLWYFSELRRVFTASALLRLARLFDREVDALQQRVGQTSRV